MKFNISGILTTNGASLSIKGSEVIKAFGEIEHEYVFEEPVSFEGTVTNEGGLLRLEGKLAVNYKAVCYRCLKELKFSLHSNVNEVFASNNTKTDDEVYTYEGNYIDIDRVLMDNILLNLPMRQLCSKKCRGLCQACGGNLNEKSCQCNEDILNPQMEVLKKFFEN